MKPINNYETVQASSGEIARPQAGGYICKIVNVVDVPMNHTTGKGDYLKIEYDIAEGDFRGYYKALVDRFGGTWNASLIRSYKESALGMFKHFMNCVEKSNKNYEWDWNETGLIGKTVGFVLGEEEYENSMGQVKTRLAVKQVKTVDEIRNGDFTVPALKKLTATNAVTSPVQPVTEEDLPF